MAFGFPASHTEEFTLDHASGELRTAVRNSFATLRWKLKEETDDSLTATTGPNMRSWGEQVTVTVLSRNSLSVTSKCRMPTQAIDLGKNATNLKNFIRELRSQMRNPRAPEPIQEGSKSPRFSLPLIAAGVPLVIYPFLLLANIMSLAGARPANPPPFLLSLGVNGFLWGSTLYPLFYLFCIGKYREQRDTLGGRRSRLFSWLPLVYLAGVGVFFAIWFNSRHDWSVKGADSETFEVIEIDNGRQLSRDKDHVYIRSAIIEGADPGSFRKTGAWYRDKDSVFIRVDGEIKQLSNSDPDSFQRIDKMFWSKDDTRVFFQDRGFIPDDIGSFQILDSFWARDDVSHYYKNRKIANLDHASFKVNEKHKTFAKDRDRVLWRGWDIRGCDAESFVTTSLKEGHDNRTKFYCILKDERHYGERYRGDKETVEIIRERYLKPQAAP